MCVDSSFGSPRRRRICCGWERVGPELRIPLLSNTITLLLLILWSTGAEAQSWSTLQLSRQLQDERELTVDVNYASGRFTFGPVESPSLYGIHLHYDDERFEPIHSFESDRLTVGVDGRDRGSRFGRGSSEGALDLRLSNAIPLDLDFEFGAVRADVELGGLRLENFRFATGASETRIRVSSQNPDPMGRVTLRVGAASLEATGLGRLNAEEIRVDAGVGDVDLEFDGLTREETRIDADMGIGRLTIRIPQAAGIRLVRDSFLTSLDAPDLTRRGDVYYSSNWDASGIRVFIDVNAAFGRVSVVRLRE